MDIFPFLCIMLPYALQQLAGIRCEMQKMPSLAQRYSIKNASLDLVSKMIYGKLVYFTCMPYIAGCGQSFGAMNINS